MAKTVFDRLAAVVGLIVFSPLFAMVAVAVALEDGFPVLFRQTRLGKGGRPFQLLKFRSMRMGLTGSRITAGKDPRVGRVGRFLRRYKLDELPQLWNVLKGEMSLVGPRPEVPAFGDVRDRTWSEVLSVKPGITDLASLVFRNEEEVLTGANNPEQYYREVILPAKLRLNLQYIRGRCFWLDIRLILLTVRYSLFPSRFDPSRIQQLIPAKTQCP
ncbi:MAG: sugar transferase [Acidobacteria bacterium]|nr:sugar transferase [Acidobacteriota bacterium]